MTQSEIVTLPYLLNPQEIREFYFHTYYRSAFTPVSVVFNLLTLVVCPLWLYRPDLEPTHWMSVIIWVVAFSAFIFVLVPAVLSVASWQRYKKTPSNASPRTAKATPKGLIFNNDYVHTELGWTAITDMRRSANLLMFYGNRQCAFMVPVRAFSEAGEAEAFIEAARHFKAQHTSQKAPPSA